MKGWIIFIAFVMVFAGCKQKSGKVGSVQVLADTASFYPIAHFIHGQIEEADLSNLPRTFRYTSNQQTSIHSLGRDSFLLFCGLFDSLLTQFNKQSRQLQVMKKPCKMKTIGGKKPDKTHSLI